MLPTITDFFVPQMRQSDGSIRMIEPVALSHDRIYILNRQGAKLLQLRLKNELPNDRSIILSNKDIPFLILHLSSRLKLDIHSVGKEQKNPKKSHRFNADYNEPTRIDFYLSGGGMNYQDFVDSEYFLNLFFTPEYLCTNKSHPLQGGSIVRPITTYSSGEYLLWKTIPSVHQ